MPLVLVIGSHVAGSRVGGTVASLVLAGSPWLIDPVHVPTTLLGRHPGWGDPGGAAVAASTMETMLSAIEANGLFAGCDGVLCDYFADADQVAVAASAIRRIKAARPDAHILIDPVMGDVDAGGDYVPAPVITAVIDQLLPLATIITPNPWELGRIASQPPATNPAGFWKQADIAMEEMATDRPEVIATSYPFPTAAGMALFQPGKTFTTSHKRFAQVPRGTGDMAAAAYLACRIGGHEPEQSLTMTGAYVASVLANAVAWGAPELPVVASRASWQEALDA